MNYLVQHTGLREEEELVFGREPRRVSEVRGVVDDLLQQLARTGGEGRPIWLREVEQEERHVVLPGDRPLGCGVDPAMEIGVPRVPPCHLDIDTLVKFVLAVPAEDDVAETQTSLQGRLKLLDGDVFSSEDAVDIEAAQAHSGRTRGHHLGEDLTHGLRAQWVGHE